MKAYAASLRGCLLACLVAAPALGAGEAPKTPADPCWNDMGVVCPGVSVGGGRMMDCLIAHQDQVSGACKAYMGEIKEKVKEVSKTCQDDIAIFCPDTAPGHGTIIKCLKDNVTEISVECQESMRR